MFPYWTLWNAVLLMHFTAKCFCYVYNPLHPKWPKNEKRHTMNVQYFGLQCFKNWIKYWNVLKCMYVYLYIQSIVTGFALLTHGLNRPFHWLLGNCIQVAFTDSAVKSATLFTKVKVTGKADFNERIFKRMSPRGSKGTLVRASKTKAKFQGGTVTERGSLNLRALSRKQDASEWNGGATLQK